MNSKDKPALVISLLPPPLAVKGKFLLLYLVLSPAVLYQLPLHALFFRESLQPQHFKPLGFGFCSVRFRFLALNLQLPRSVLRLLLKATLLSLLLSLPLFLTALPVGFFLLGTSFGIALRLRNSLKDPVQHLPSRRIAVSRPSLGITGHQNYCQKQCKSFSHRV